ncbi:MAG: hypothetical protein HY900_13795 [Deltaproteobacteria bacterium]|nr:hypothetical protein [Deltaproteobacteria bacterium]
MAGIPGEAGPGGLAGFVSQVPPSALGRRREVFAGIVAIVFGAAVLQRPVLWAALVLTLRALDSSLPLAAVRLGVSLGAPLLVAKAADAAVRWGGVVLRAAGFDLLATL